MSQTPDGRSTPTTLSFLPARAEFEANNSSPQAFLGDCLSRIELHEASVLALVATDFERAKAEAEQSAQRWRDGAPLSPIDGMPVGVKDIMETAHMPTEQGSPLFTNWSSARDCAAVAALREAGAIIVAKTVTTEFASTTPTRGTCNPFDLSRTPGGSSSGSAAAVACGMMPAALATQVVGSTIRPASFCGVIGYKPSVGAINRGGSFDGLSQSCTGVIAATLDEAWIVAREIAARAGGDPGFVGLMGPQEPPESNLPKRVALLRTGAYERASGSAIKALAAACAGLKQLGIEVVTSEQQPSLNELEKAIAEAQELSMKICAWERRWPLNTYRQDMDQQDISEASLSALAEAESMSQADYGACLARRQQARECYAAHADSVDACVTLAATGAAPVGLDYTGDPGFTVLTSLLGVPSVSLPLLEDDGMPLGLQVIGFQDRDAELFAHCAAIQKMSL